MATKLKSHSLKGFNGGYNSYPASRTLVKDNEIPVGENVVLDDNGSATKRNGYTAFGVEISSGHVIMGMGVLKNTSYNKLIAACNTSWYSVTSSTKTALTGMTFTADKKTRFVQGVDRLYGANNTNNLAYTTDGSTVTEVTSNGNIGFWPIVYGQRMYMTNATYPDRIYYSNPTTYSTGVSPTYAAGDFGTFNVDLTATPKKNAGFIILLPGSGLEITRLFKDSTSGTDYIYVYTKMHGIWRIAYSSVNSDGSIAHTISQVVTSDGSPAGGSVIKVGNDQWFRSKWNYSSLGEAAQYQNIRISTKGGRVKSEATGVSGSVVDDTEGGFFKEKIYFAYTAGSYNDRVLAYDTRLNAWSTPLSGLNISQFLEWEDDSNVTHFLGASSKSTASYIYDLESGTDDNGAAIDAYFETKSTDCKLPGLIKRFAFIDVFYSTIYGTLDYEVFIDEVSSITGTLQLGNSTDISAGIGSLPIGSFPIGAEYDSNTTFASLQQNDTFRIECNYEAGKTISVKFSNSVIGEQFRINNIVVWYLPGSEYEQ